MESTPSNGVPSPPPGPQFTLTGFNHRRVYRKLPPGYDWETQIKKYCPSNLSGLVKGNVRGRGYVYCHRGLYERSMKIPENSQLAIKNGLMHGLLLHEIDVRINKNPEEAFVAHDETASRVTASTERWSALSSSKRKITSLVTKRFDDAKKDFASTYEMSEEMVPQLLDLLGVDWKNPKLEFQHLEHPYMFRYPSFPDREIFSLDGRCFQIDLRGDDLAKAIAYYQANDALLFKNRMILKGYNLEYTSGQALKEAVDREARRQRKQADLSGFGAGPLLIMVFYAKAVIAHTLEAKARKEKGLLEVKARDVLEEVMKQALSYFEVCRRDFIPEIVYTGLGLGYNPETGTAVNPLGGTLITDPEVIFESLVDHGMILASIELRQKYPSCTRLCDVRTSTQEWIANMVTGALELKPTGEKGISSKLRGIHGGLYPQSDLVVADDPLSEVAARTWIDEYAALDRVQLLTLSYDEWLAQAGPEVVEAINGLNGSFWPNIWEGPLNIIFDDSESMIRDSREAGLAPKTKRAPITVMSLVTAQPSRPSSHYQQDSRSLLQHSLRNNEEFVRGTL